MRTLLRRLGVAVLLVGALIVLVLALTPPYIASNRFEAGGALTPEQLMAFALPLTGCELFAADEVVQPEELEVDSEGRIYLGDRSGRVLRMTPNGDGYRVEEFASPGGHPQGLTLEPGGALLVSEGYHVPHARIHQDGRIDLLPMLRGADTAVSRDGAIYFSAPHDWKRTGNTFVDFVLMIFEARPEGELHVLEPGETTSRRLSNGFLVPDGVALSSDESFVVVGEVGGYRVSRHWLKGPQAGTTDTLVEELPGLPDGVASDGNGRFFVALAGLRPPLLDFLHAHPWLKDQLSKLAHFYAPEGAPSAAVVQAPGFVVVLSERGGMDTLLVEPEGLVGPGITSAVPHGEHLMLASLAGRGVARCELPDSLRGPVTREAQPRM